MCAGHAAASAQALVSSQCPDQADLFEQRNECARQHDPLLGMPPAQQGLETGQSLGARLDQRLVEKLELLLGQRAPQLGFQQAPLLDLGVHARLEEAPCAAAVILGAI
jgi:hypothetical protein